MYLVDTSVWVGYLRNQDNLSIRHLIKILDQELPFAITNVIYQEILQGAVSKKEFKCLSAYFSTQRFFKPIDEILTYEAAAKLYFDCRRKGLIVRSTIDCLIAQIAIEHNLVLLHNDKDFLALQMIAPALTLI